MMRRRIKPFAILGSILICCFTVGCHNSNSGSNQNPANSNSGSSATGANPNPSLPPNKGSKPNLQPNSSNGNKGTSSPNSSLTNPNSLVPQPRPSKASIKKYGEPPHLPKAERSGNSLMQNAYGSGEVIAIPDGPGQGGWGKTSLTPLQIAKRADRSLAGLVNAFSDARVHIVVPKGRGDSTLLSKIGKPGFYKVQYTAFEGDHPATFSIISNGKMIYVVRNTVYAGQKMLVGSINPNDKYPTISGSTLLDKWPTEMPALVLNQFRDRQDVYVPLIKAMLSGHGGYDVVAEQRSVAYKEQIVTDYRIVAIRSKAAQKKLGWSEIEMVFDGGRYLPLTFRTRYMSPTDQAYELDWTSRWGPETFTKSDFLLPKDSGIVNPSN